MKLIFSIVLLLVAIFTIANADTLIFDTTQAQACTTLLNPCFFDDPDNWGGKNVTPGDSFIIDLSSLSYSDINSSIVYFKTRSALVTGTFGSFIANTSSTVSPSIFFANTKSLIFTTMSVTNGALRFENVGGSQANNNIEITQSWIIKNTSVVGLDTNLVSEGISVDPLSSFSFSSQSSVQINGISTFFVQPQFLDSNLAVSDAVDGYVVFHQGILCDNTVILGKSTLYGKSNFETLIINEIADLSNATVFVDDFISFSTNNSQIVLSGNSTIQISGTQQVNLKNVVLNDQSKLTILNANCNIGALTGTGGIISYEIDPLSTTELSNNHLTSVNGLNIYVHLSGSVSLFVQDSIIESIIEIPAPKSNPTKLLTFEGANMVGAITTSNTQVTVADDAKLILWDIGTGIYNNYLNVMGELILNQVSITLSDQFYIYVADTLGSLVVNGSNVFGSVKLDAGQISTYGASEITKNLIVNGGGVVSFNTDSGTLTTGTLTLLGTLYIDNHIQPDETAQLYVNGNVSLQENATLLVDFLNLPNRGQNYNLVGYSGSCEGSFAFVTLWYDGELYNTIKSGVELTNGGISLVFEPSVKPSKRVPGWGVFLIIVSILAVVAGVFYAFYRYKKREGYLPLN
ncbi:hypothetical protein DICPUDRAFT_96371 [Dictyostelium purpureum]|uniref:Auto-transporter adhesin head GIN domain-containing protein n=1 Tax=Dictyostelium purpureum TaxID=5786 RepID=F0Z7M6_DICPU|nr:uncharacterized protein DICPUDRAFT_96371 [Dictyostelium purpureum]EGC40041.1 hypothetical protein DICPUDRAFT_96371 [Dictyostelium purpureum]|eukprot:XP_003283390.1 hypothetical protein DICPUDRAFT_96371 [Dictyostelium purpureum]